jgi:hypothetical protein
MQTVEQNLEPLGDQKITGLGTVKSLTVPAGAEYALVQAQTQDVLWRDSGTNPEAGTGFLLSAGGPALFYTGKLSQLRFIESAASAVLFVSYYRPRTLAS